MAVGELDEKVFLERELFVLVGSKKSYGTGKKRRKT
jgi:hypothetical protein